MPLADSFQTRLTVPQMAALEEISAETGLNRADLVRRAVECYIEVFRDEQEAALRRASSKIATQRHVDALMSEIAENPVPADTKPVKRPARIIRR